MLLPTADAHRGVVNSIRIGTAGWANPPACRAHRPAEHSHLQHYAARFNCVELNSSFYRSHRAQTYARWRARTPEGFRFAIKLPRAFSHGPQLHAPVEQLQRFFAETGSLQRKLAVLLLQLPPTRQFDAQDAARFFSQARRHTSCPMVCEPRHVSWFAGEARALLAGYGIGLVCADPPRAGQDVRLPTGTVRYFRLHGSPRVYYSRYSEEYLTALSARLAAEATSGAEVWCVFDNTAEHAAWGDASRVQQLLNGKKRPEAVPEARGELS